MRRNPKTFYMEVFIMSNMTMAEMYEEKEYWYQMLLVAEGNWERTEYILEQIEKLSKEMASRRNG
jgi:hypothetical protein